MQTLKYGGMETKLGYQELSWSSSSVENVKNHIFNQSSELHCWVCHWQIGSVIDRLSLSKLTEPDMFRAVFGYDRDWIWTCTWKQNYRKISGLQLFCWDILEFTNGIVIEIGSNSQVWNILTENSLNLSCSEPFSTMLEAKFEKVAERRTVAKC